MKKRLLRNARKPMALAIAAALGSMPVHAQDTEMLEEIVVTATRRSTSIQDTPLNIAAVSGETLNQQRLTSLTEFARWVPGLTQVPQGPRASDLLTVRGLNVNSLSASEFLGNGSGDTVATYVGEIPLYLDFKLKDVDRVEVLLGPQGTLYGAGTLGGAVRYLPNKPDTSESSFDIHTRVYSLAESNGTGTDTDFTFNIPLAEERLALRATVSYLDDPGFIDYNFLVREPGVSNPQPDFSDPADVAANLRTQRDADFEETVSARVALLWNISDTVEATLSYYFQDQEAGGRTVNHRDSFGTDRYVSGHRYLEPNDRRNELISIEVVADLGFAELTSATGFSNYEELGQRDQTDLLLDFEYGYEDFPSFAAFTREISDDDRINQEIRLVSTGEGPWNWIVGVFYNELDSFATSEEFTPGIPQFFGVERPDNLEYFQLTESKVTEKAIFGEVGYQFNDRWQVTVGARLFDFEEDSNVGFDLPLLDTLLGEQGPTEIVFDSQANSTGDDDVIFKFNTSYYFTDDVLGYFTISEGYRLGGVNSVPPCSVPLDPQQNVCALPNEVLIAPDSTTNYEFGIHSTWLGGRLTFNGALYFIDWEDIQVAGTTVNGAIPITVNGGSAESQGVEMSVRALVADNWTIQGTYAYNDAQLTSDAPGLVDGFDAFDGDRLAGSPEHQASLFVAYNRALSNGWDLNANYGISSISDVYTKVGLRNNGEVLGGFSVHSAAVSVAQNNWEVTLFADNLFNTYAETAVRDDFGNVRQVGDFALRRYFKNVIRPRAIGVEFRYSFDM